MAEAMAAASVALPIIGAIAGPKGDQGAGDMSAEAIRALRAVVPPSVSDQELQLLLPQLMGQLTPQTVSAEQQAPSEMGKIQLDPRLQAAQMQALSNLQKVGQVGMTDADKAMLNQIRQQVEQQENARQASILQNMAQRGVAGGGTELAARLGSTQDAANRAAQLQQQQVIEAANRSLSAMAQSGNLAGNISQQQFGQEAQKASAADLINRFNVANRQQVQEQNVAAQNRAQQLNLAEQQRMADIGVQTRNRQQEANKALLQQQFQNQMEQARGLSSAFQADATRRQAAAQKEREQFSNIMGGAGKSMGALSGLMGKPTDDTLDISKGVASAKDTDRYEDAYNAYGQS